MGKQTFGGDDEGGEAAEQPQKPKLSKFELAPDTNVRDVFWRVMASYATTKKPGIEPEELYEYRFAFVKIALSLLERREGRYYGMSNQLIVRYLLMLFLDNGWNDAAQKMLEELKEGRQNSWIPLIHSLRQLLKVERYKESTIELLRTMIRNTDVYPVALFYILALKNKEVITRLKKELYIFARGDIEENQMNAINALALLNDDSEVIGMMLSLLSHWNTEVRRAAAEGLKGMKLNEDAVRAIESKVAVENDEETKRTLEKIVGKWKK
ncbi:MAG: HEAT repeat domain-containing protein [Candidatus Bilamarchaeaceae archaeon]